jgi:hypothetical protein
MSRGISIADIDLSKCGPNSPLHELAKKKPRKPRVEREHLEQVKLFAWAEEQKATFPVLSLMFAIPNFAGRLGNLTARHGAYLKAEGRKPGVPDIFLPVARGPYRGLFIELKAEGNWATDEQLAWCTALREQGYQALVRIGFEAARDAILLYLTGDPHV